MLDAMHGTNRQEELSQEDQQLLARINASQRLSDKANQYVRRRQTAYARAREEAIERLVSNITKQ